MKRIKLKKELASILANDWFYGNPLLMVFRNLQEQIDLIDNKERPYLNSKKIKEKDYVATVNAFNKKRDSLELSDREIAKLTGVNYVTINRFGKGKTLTTKYNLMKIRKWVARKR